MADGKDPKLTELEQSLINFLTSKKEIEEKVSGGARRLRSLSLGLNVKDKKNAFFTIQIGMCEATFNITTGLKEKGSCFGIERYVRDWYERPSVSHEFKTLLQQKIKD